MPVRTVPSPEAMRVSLLASIDDAVRFGGVDPLKADLLRRVLVPFAEIFTERQCERDISSLIKITDIAAAAIVSHALLNLSLSASSTEAAVDRMLGYIRASVLGSMNAAFTGDLGRMQ